MGLFGKLSENMHHGGVKVHVQAPSSVPGNQVIPVTVTMTADSAQTINSVKAEIKAQAKEQGITMGGGMGNNNGMGIQSGRTTHQTVAEVESREPFTISPGETKTINLQLYLNGSAGSGNPLAQMNTGGGGIGGALQAMASVAQTFDHINYIYTVHASADVQGVSLNPSDKQPIQILPPTAEAAVAQPAQPVAAAISGQQQAPAPAAPPLPPAPVMPVPPLQPPQTPETPPTQPQ